MHVKFNTLKDKGIFLPDSFNAKQGICKQCHNHQVHR